MKFLSTKKILFHQPMLLHLIIKVILKLFGTLEVFRVG